MGHRLDAGTYHRGPRCRWPSGARATARSRDRGNPRAFKPAHQAIHRTCLCSQDAPAQCACGRPAASNAGAQHRMARGSLHWSIERQTETCVFVLRYSRHAGRSSRTYVDVRMLIYAVQYSRYVPYLPCTFVRDHVLRQAKSTYALRIVDCGTMLQSLVRLRSESGVTQP